jgi:hypothetical protein
MKTSAIAIIAFGIEDKLAAMAQKLVISAQRSDPHFQKFPILMKL